MIRFDSDYHAARRNGEHSVLVPARLESKTALLEFLKHALQLPPYFGGNWDALEECLLELAAKGDAHTVLVHHDLPLESEPEEQRVYLRILGAVAGSGARLDAVFPEALRESVTRFLAQPETDC